jgi:hypothetical protein
MTLLWSVTGAQWTACSTFCRSGNEQPPGFEIVNEIAIQEYKFCIHGEYGDHEDAERELVQFRGMPKPVFRFADPGFKLD